MSARLNLFSAILASAFTIGLAVASPALAGGPSTPCCKPPPPPCCKPSPPPPCCSGGHQINIPNVNVNVGATVIVNASAQAFGAASANAGAGAVVFAGGGGGSSIGFTQSSGMIQGLNVEGAKLIRTPFKATRTRIKVVIIRAVCIDDRDIPHPASQVSPEKEIAEGFEGELFRCLAGTRMQYTIADFSGKIDFDQGRTMNCAKGEALYKSAQGELACRPQRPARDCNERSLLRRFGAGVKIIKIVEVETYEAFREEVVQSSTAVASGMSIDGGVGGIVY
jgi:hypothetical protein